MRCSIFDKEKNDLLREEDSSVIIFTDQDKAVGYLQDEGLKDEFIKSNFVFLKRTQPLIPDVMAFKESQIIEFFRCKNCGEEFNTSEGLKIHACETSSHPEQGEQGEVYKWVKADKNNLPVGEQNEKRHITYKTSPDILVFLNGRWCWWDDKSRGLFHVQDDSWSAIEWLCKLSSPPPEGQNDPVAFAKWIGCKFFYDDESELWETIPEGKTYDFNGQKQFRFTSDELYKLFKMQKDFIGDPDECTGAFEGQ